MRPLVEHFRPVNVAECPVVVALVDQVVRRTWRVVLMAADTAESRVENADVEGSADGFRIL